MAAMTSSGEPAVFDNDTENDIYKCVIGLELHEFSKVKVGKSVLNAYLPMRNLGLKGVHGVCWKLDVYSCSKVVPEGEPSYSEKKDHIGAFLALDNETTLEFDTDFYFVALSQDGEVLAHGDEANFVFKDQDDTKGSHYLLRHDSLFKNELFIDDYIRIEVRIQFTIVAGDLIEDLLTPSDLVGRSMAMLYKSKQHSDFQLQSSDDKLFSAHKLVLATRSEVFAAMFEHNLKEVQTGVCVIKDVDGETLEGMLKFLYGQNEWNPKLAEKLIIAANKYKIVDLIKGCTRELTKHLTFWNAAYFLNLAEENTMLELKESVSDFIVNDVEGFFAAGGFLELRENVALLEHLQELTEDRRKTKKLKTY